jgi:hypothetical protein
MKIGFDRVRDADIVPNVVHDMFARHEVTVMNTPLV